MSYKLSDYYELKFAALLQNGIMTEGSGESMMAEVDGKKRFFGHRKGELHLSWTNGYDPKTKFDCACNERLSEKGYSSFRDCPSDLICATIAGYIEYADLRDAFANVKLTVN